MTREQIVCRYNVAYFTIQIIVKIEIPDLLCLGLSKMNESMSELK